MDNWFLDICYLGMGIWALFGTLPSSWIVGLPKPCRYRWKNWYLVFGMHFVCNNVSLNQRPLQQILVSGYIKDTMQLFLSCWCSCYFVAHQITQWPINSPQCWILTIYTLMINFQIWIEVMEVFQPLTCMCSFIKSFLSANCQMTWLWQQFSFWILDMIPALKIDGQSTFLFYGDFILALHGYMTKLWFCLCVCFLFSHADIRVRIILHLQVEIAIALFIIFSNFTF